MKNAARHYAKGESMTQSVINSYDTKDRNTASKIGVEIKKRPEFQAYVQQLLEKHMSTDRLMQKHSDLLDADREEVQFKALESAYKLKQMPGYGQEVNLNLHKHEVSFVDDLAKKAIEE